MPEIGHYAKSMDAKSVTSSSGKVSAQRTTSSPHKRRVSVSLSHVSTNSAAAAHGSSLSGEQPSIEKDDILEPAPGSAFEQALLAGQALPAEGVGRRRHLSKWERKVRGIAASALTLKAQEKTLKMGNTIQAGDGSGSAVAVAADSGAAARSSAEGNGTGTLKKKLGTDITPEHAQYNLTYGMMVGIRVSVSRTESAIQMLRAKELQANDYNDQLVRESELYGSCVNYSLSKDDFSAVDKWVFPSEGTRETPPHKLPHSFKFKDYAPRVFRNIRKMYKIDAVNYILSLASSAQFIEFITNSKSGQYVVIFFVTTCLNNRSKPCAAKQLTCLDFHLQGFSTTRTTPGI